MKFGLRFFISWFLCAVVMFSLFYLWHGVFLNDFKRIQFPLFWFQIFAAITYLILGAGSYILYESSIFQRIKNPVLRGVFSGLILGFTIFMIASIVNISLTKHLSVQHLMIDCVWQMTEQVLGGLVIVLLKFLIHEPVPERA